MNFDHGFPGQGNPAVSVPVTGNGQGRVTNLIFAYVALTCFHVFYNRGGPFPLAGVITEYEYR